MKVSAAIELFLALMTQLQRISGMIANAILENRDLSPAERAEIKAADDASRVTLVDAIAKAEAEGR